MKRIYEKIPVRSVLDYVNPYTRLVLIDDHLDNRKPALIYDGLCRDFDGYAKTKYISIYKAEKAQVHKIIPSEECLEIHIDTRYEEF